MALPQFACIVRSVARRLRWCAEDLEDLGQEASILLWRMPQTARLNATYVYRLVWHRALDILLGNRNARGARASHGVAASPSELRLLLRVEVSRLPRLEQQICRLIFIEGLTEREAAKRSGVSRGSVQRLGKRILDRLGAASHPLSATSASSSTGVRRA